MLTLMWDLDVDDMAAEVETSSQHILAILRIRLIESLTKGVRPNRAFDAEQCNWMKRCEKKMHTLIFMDINKRLQMPNCNAYNQEAGKFYSPNRLGWLRFDMNHVTRFHFVCSNFLFQPSKILLRTFYNYLKICFYFTRAKSCLFYPFLK